MRSFAPLVALLVLAASAGCLSEGDESGGASPPPSPPAAEAPPEATPPATPPPAEASPTPAPAEPTPPPAPEAPARKELYNASVDFASQGDATGQSPKAQKTSAALAVHSVVFLNVTLTRSGTTAAVPVSGTVNSPAVRVFDPQGQEAALVMEEGAFSQELPAQPGEWTVQYEGAGTLRATVVLTAI